MSPAVRVLLDLSISANFDAAALVARAHRQFDVVRAERLRRIGTSATLRDLPRIVVARPAVVVPDPGR